MYFPRLSDFDTIAVDIEGTGVTWYRDEMFGFAVSTQEDDYYWDIRETPKALDWLYDEMKHYNGLIVNHNIKFDAHFLRQVGIDISRKNIKCTMVRSQLIDENRWTYDLDGLCQDYLGKSKYDPYEELAAMFGGKPTRDAQMKNLWRAPSSLVDPYAKTDTRRVLELWEWQLKEIEKQGLGDICTLEDAVLPVLTRMESRGLRIDVGRAEENMEMLAKKIDRLQHEIDKAVGNKFNINSTPQMREFFKPKRIEGTNQWRLIDGTIAQSTAGSLKEDKDPAPSLDKETLESMNHPVARMVVDMRTMMKIHGTFLRDQILGYQEDGWIYPNFKQCGTVNGRFAASQPALQAVPKRNKEMSALTRSVFLADDEGDELLRCDFEQSDFRGFVHYTQSPPLVAAYSSDPWTDFHKLISSLLSIPRSPQKNGGANAKQINLGSIFGMGPGKLAKEMRLPFTEEISKRGKVWLKPGPEAEEVFSIYHRNVPGVEGFNKKASAVARSRGYVISIHGRHLRFPNKNVVYKAPGYLYSSFTSDLCKAAMVACDDIEGADIKLQVHDEIIFNIKERSVIPEIKYGMENALGNRPLVPIRTNPEVGPNWFECKPLAEA